MTEEKDLSLRPAPVAPVKDDSYSSRLFQGIPGIECSRSGRLWAAFYSGGETEGPDNYVTLVTSEDGGKNWSDLKYVIDPPGQVRAFDPCLWHDPTGRLWLFWSQSYTHYDGRAGVFASICDNSDSANPVWLESRRIADGIMMNKPTVLANGEWLLPIAVWEFKQSPINDLPEERYSNVYHSADQGKTFQKIGFADVPNREYDEHMIVERKDNSLWMLVRTTYGIGASSSYDGGITWTKGIQSPLGGPGSRFFIRRLQSGKLLLVNHYMYRRRSHLTAMLSEDDGLSWYGHLLLDERVQVSYPDGVQAEDGRIYIIYDFERKDSKEILLASVTEEDIINGKIVSDKSFLKQIVNKA
ncbi:sialidase family protein [Paenibacillus sp. GCM10012303]|jgi:predicted neuraminidase|uniref:sialidase family protein n=1 Tax=Paenibacillus sp. GCM10012303 TaxID=3317340 RepID=UPI00360CC582